MKSLARIIKEKPLSHSRWLYAAGIFLLSIIVFLRLGLNGTLVRDNAYNLYMGQSIAKGIPHYVGVFDSHTPLAPMVIGGGSYFASSFGLDQILTVRVQFLIFSALAVLVIYLLAMELFGSNSAAFFASIIFMSFPEFALSATYGPQAKSLMVLFHITVIYKMTQKSWFWAGFFAALAFLIWQPYLILLFAVIVVAYLQSREMKTAGKMALVAAMGCLLPVILVFAYFEMGHAVSEFI
jgi:Gpi18-like mannosyltransferase